MSKAASIERIEAQALRRQQIAFCVLTMFLFAALLLLHTHFSYLLGEPSEGVIIILAFACSIKIIEWIWLYRQKSGITEHAARISTAISIPAMFLLLAAGAVIALFRDPGLLGALGNVHLSPRLPSLALGSISWHDLMIGTLFLALPQVLFQALAVGDVGEDADGADHGTLVGQQRVGDGLQPALAHDQVRRLPASPHLLRRML